MEHPNPTSIFEKVSIYAISTLKKKKKLFTNRKESQRRLKRKI